MHGVQNLYVTQLLYTQRGARGGGGGVRFGSPTSRPLPSSRNVRRRLGFLDATWLLPFVGGDASGAGGGTWRRAGMTFAPWGVKGAVGRLLEGKFRTCYTALAAVGSTCNQRRHGSAKPEIARKFPWMMGSSPAATTYLSESVALGRCRQSGFTRQFI